MSLSDLAAVGSFISGFAVLVSLIFLYFQLRQVTAQVQQAETNQRALMNQGYVTRTIDLLKFHTEPHRSALFSEVLAGKTDFTAEEVSKLSFSLRCSLLNLQDCYVQHRAGLVDNITFENAVGAMKAYMGLPVYRGLWAMGRANFAPELVDFVDKLIAELPPAGPADFPALLRIALSEIAR